MILDTFDGMKGDKWFIDRALCDIIEKLNLIPALSIILAI